MIDREYQKDLLDKLCEKYPFGIDTGNLYSELDEQGKNKFLFTSNI